jgi:PAS domain S-box-containing protein
MPLPDHDLRFLADGGTMGRLMRAHDWGSSPLGEPRGWPAPLRFAVRLILNSGHPMYIWWGPELACLYNDAYSRLVGPEHVASLGRPAREVWGEIWDIIGPQIDHVMDGSGATWHENALVPITRHGAREDIYWTYSYSPIDDAALPSGVGGVLVICTETTATVLARARVSEAARRQQRLFEQSPGFIIIMRGPDHVVELVNDGHRAAFNSDDWPGKTIREAFPGIAIQGFLEKLDQVYRTGETYHAEAAPVVMRRTPGRAPETHYLTFIYAPLYDDDGAITGIFCQGQDVTEAKIASRHTAVLAQLGDRIRQIADPDELAYAAAEILGRELEVGRAGYGNIDMAAETIRIERDWTAPGVPSLAGTLQFRDYGSYIEELKRGETVICSDALTDPRTADNAEALRGIDAQSFINMPVTEHDGFVALLYLTHAGPRTWSDAEIALIHEVAERTRTAVERRRAEAAVRSNETRLRFITAFADAVATAGNADAILATSTRMLGQHLGASICAYADMEPDEDHFTIRGDWSEPGSPSIVGYYSLADFGDLAVRNLHANKPLVVEDNLVELAPEAARTFLALGIRATICIPFVREGRLTALMAVHDKAPRHWSDHEIALVADVTGRSWAHIERVRSEQAARASADRLRLATQSASIGTWDYDLLVDVLRWDESCKAMFGIDDNAPVTYDGTFLPRLHPDDRSRVDEAVRSVLTSPDPQPFETEFRVVDPHDGTTRWIASTGGTMFEDGKPARFIGAVIDVTARKKAEEDLRTVNDTGARVAAEFDLEKIVQIITDAGVQLSGAQFGAFFYNVTDAAGESYMLFSLSGAPLAAFRDHPMPRMTPIFAPTFHGSGIVRSDDILADPRFGLNPPYNGMPEGHLPVRSYLAVPVVSNAGEVLGGLFFGHAESGRFRSSHESVLMGIAGHAATAIDNARLFQKAEREIADRRKAEEALQVLNATLEERVAEEVAQRTRAEDHLRQAQKMEAMGQLTGGIAHDFNNMLAVVIGGLNLVQRRLAKGDTDVSPFIQGAVDAARRAAGLTQRLLAFSRQQPLAPKPLNVNRMVLDMSELLTRTLGETIEVQTVLGRDLWQVEVDPGQLESALLNLSVNARDAMPSGGRLTIATSNTEIDAGQARDAGIDPGPFVLIEVTDTGEGMLPEVMSKAFEPFFTTKDVGKGTGLGLSQVYGFVRQSAGDVGIDSRVGTGTTFRIYLPRHGGPGDPGACEAPSTEIPRGTEDEIVMVVEDDDRVRAVSVEALRELGYTVVEMSGPGEALRAIEAGTRLSLLFTDVVMPGMSGRDLAEAARRIRPALKVLYTTGYPGNENVLDDTLSPATNLVPKPYSIEDLARKVREVLDQDEADDGR